MAGGVSDRHQLKTHLTNGLNYLLTLQWCGVIWFGVHMGFSNEDQILIENLYVVKVMEQKNLLRNFQIKVGDCGD